MGKKLNNINDMEKYINIELKELSNNELYGFIDEIEAYIELEGVSFDFGTGLIEKESNSNEYVYLKMALDRLTNELDNRKYNTPYFYNYYYDDEEDEGDKRFLSEMRRKSKRVTGRQNKLKEFKKSDKIYKNSFMKRSFKFIEEEENDDYYFKRVPQFGEGRYVKYYDKHKYLKKLSNRRLRQNIYDLPVKGSKYKRVLDIDWIIN